MTEKLFEEIMFQKFPNLTQDIKLQIQEILTPSRINSNRPIMRYIVVELSKDKDRILEVAKEKWLITFNWFLSRNYGGQKTMRWHIYSAKRIKLNEEVYIWQTVQKWGTT